MGEYFRDEIMDQHELDVYFNLQKKELHRVHDVGMPHGILNLYHFMAEKGFSSAATLP